MQNSLAFWRFILQTSCNQPSRSLNLIVTVSENCLNNGRRDILPSVFRHPSN